MYLTPFPQRYTGPRPDIVTNVSVEFICGYLKKKMVEFEHAQYTKQLKSIFDIALMVVFVIT